MAEDGAQGRLSRPSAPLALRLANLALLVLYPLAWFAPLIRAGWLPLFSLSEISVVTGLQSLWRTDIPLALIVTVFALFAPYLKTIGLALVHWQLLDARALPALTVLGKLAMADIFLIALYITIAKGIGVGRIEVAWGLYLFTACILASIALGILTERARGTHEA
ncbi:MAG: paraquat-inducible protein A [Sedimentitalea sp.]|nr:paraquat-inducible protein A [Sedimentitalea sp.]